LVSSDGHQSAALDLIYTHSVLNPLPKLITAVGIVCIVTGLSWGFLDGSDFAFRFLSDSLNRFITEHSGLFGMTLFLGILLSAGETIAWTHHFDKRKRLKVAGYIFLVGLLAMLITPGNVHGPGMLVVMTAVCGWILSIVLAVIAVARSRPFNEQGSKSD
jgi:hypothetical protein